MQKLETPPGQKTPARPTSTGSQKPISTRLQSGTEDKKAKRARDAGDFLDLVSVGATLAGMFLNKEEYLLDAAALSIHSETVGAGVAETASKNGFVASLVDRLDVVNGVAGIAVAVMPLAMQLMVNHAPKTKVVVDKDGRKREVPNEFPPQLTQMGVLSPDMLLEKAKAENEKKVAEIQAAALRETKEAQDEVDRLRKEMAESQNGKANDVPAAA
jgi:hypothetical protein